MANQKIIESFDRVNQHNNGFWRVFYERFTSQDPQIKALFAQVDMLKQFQMMSKSATYIVLNSARNEAHELDHVRQLVVKHNKELRVPKHLFLIWRECLLETLSEFDPEYDAELEIHWRQAIDIFIAPFGI
jgi:hemoglobin-like flavoprotein